MKKSVDIWLALTHPFNDPSWLDKFFVGALVAMIPTLNLAVVGYELQIIHALLRNEYHRLPKWDDMDTLLTDGVKLGVARFILALPALLLAFASTVVFLFLFYVTRGEDRVITDDRTVILLMGIIYVLLACFLGASSYSMIVVLVMPVMEVNYVRYGTLSSCFNLVAAFHFIRHNFIGYVMVCLTGFMAAIIWFAIMALSSFIPFFNFISFFVVGLPGLVWMAMAQSHALGQLLAIDTATTSS